MANSVEIQFQFAERAKAAQKVQDAFDLLIERDPIGMGSGYENGRRYCDQGLDLYEILGHLGTQSRDFESREAKVAIVVGFLTRQLEVERGEA